MAEYPNPIGKPNPFFVKQPVVYTARHVRVTSNDEVVVENANTIPRFVLRIDNNRAFPQRTQRPPGARNIPENSQKKTDW